METKFKKHLGDNVHADFQDGAVILRAISNYPDDPHDMIILNPKVVVNLVNYLSALPEKIKEQTSK
jgi:hypothetical protein